MNGKVDILYVKNALKDYFAYNAKQFIAVNI